MYVHGHDLEDSAVGSLSSQTLSFVAGLRKYNPCYAYVRSAPGLRHDLHQYVLWAPSVTNEGKV